MTNDGGYGAKGVPKFGPGGAFEDWIDLGIVGEYAARVGNRMVGTKTEREALSPSLTADRQRWAGLEFDQSDDQAGTYRFDGTDWWRTQSATPGEIWSRVETNTVQVAGTTLTKTERWGSFANPVNQIVRLEVEQRFYPATATAAGISAAIAIDRNLTPPAGYTPSRAHTHGQTGPQVLLMVREFALTAGTHDIGIWFQHDNGSGGTLNYAYLTMRMFTRG